MTEGTRASEAVAQAGTAGASRRDGHADALADGHGDVQVDGHGDARGGCRAAAPSERVADWLSAVGLRPTRQRLALADLLVGDGHDRHVTAESLFEAASAAGERVSLATVYNTLRAFCEAGLMREITVDGSKSYFDTNMSDHPHFYWEDSATLTDAPATELEIRRLPRAPDGAEIAKVDVVIRLRRK